MKSLLRVPTTESYAYIEFEVEKDTPEEVISEYRRITQLVQAGFGLEEKKFNEVLDNYLPEGGTMDVESYEQMNAAQVELIQTIKRSKKRINYNKVH